MLLHTANISLLKCFEELFSFRDESSLVQMGPFIVAGDLRIVLSKDLTKMSPQGDIKPWIKSTQMWLTPTKPLHPPTWNSLTTFSLFLLPKYSPVIKRAKPTIAGQTHYRAE